jgi:APA family basic amino acid/polyamine antiporter
VEAKNHAGPALTLSFVIVAIVATRAAALGLSPKLFDEEATVNIGAVWIIAVLTVVAVVGIKLSSMVTSVLVIVKVAVCVLILAVGVCYLKAGKSHAVHPARTAPGRRH